MSDECDVVRDRAAELALDILSGDERATLLAHVEGCAACQHEIEQLASAAAALLLVVPPADPPADLARRVRAVIADEPVRLDRRPRRTTRRWIAAAAAVVVLTVGAAVVVTVGSRDERADEIALLAWDRSAIGVVSVDREGQGWITMTIDMGSETARYDCVLDLVDGTAQLFGRISVVEGRGSWGGPVPVSLDDVRAVRVVDARGQTVATASFD